MKAMAEKYERTIEEEDELLDQLKTCEVMMRAILEHTYQHGLQRHKLMMEDILIAVFNISGELRTELIHVQFEQAWLSCQMKHADIR
jgi:hypothetical protein